MTKEDIQEAAEGARRACAESLTTRGTHHYIDDIAELAFVKGAEWRINSVWHHDQKPPKICEPILLGLFNGYVVLEIPSEEYWNTLIKDHVHVKWAYIKDLIP